MTNGEKFVTAHERAVAFAKWCEEATTYTGDCNGCHLKIMGHGGPNCRFHWLDLEAEEEKPLPCPFCGKPTGLKMCIGGTCVMCDCGYMSMQIKDEGDDDESVANAKAIAAHNRVAKSVRESEEK